MIFAGWSATGSRVWSGIALAIVLPFVCYGLRLWLLKAGLGAGLGNALAAYPFAIFYPAILIVAVLASPLAGMIALGLSVGLAGGFAGSAVGGPVPQGQTDWVGVGVFVLVGGTLVWLLHRLRRALDEGEQARRDLAEAKETLERQVAERTADLFATTLQLQQATAAREAAEAQVRQAQKMEAVGQLAGGIAQDFKPVLTGIADSLLLAKGMVGRGEAGAERHLDEALNGAERALGLTQRLVVFSRRQTLAPVVTDLNALVFGLEDVLQRSVGGTISLELALGGGLWRTAVDVAQMEHALVNLAINAREAMPDGGKLRIETKNTALDAGYAALHDGVTAGQYVLVTLSDTGRGMTHEMMERAFDPFYSTKLESRGAGLGLSEVYGFVRQSGGHIRLSSTPGKGTTVSLYLPRHRGAGELREAAVPDATLPMGDPSIVIMVVEDDEVMRLFTAETVRELGYTVVEAASGYAALRMLEARTRVTLLFTDVVMPGMSGRMLADAALRLQADLKVVFTTGYTSQALVTEGIAERGAEVLTKPFNTEQLALKLHRVLRG